MTTTTTLTRRPSPRVPATTTRRTKLRPRRNPAKKDKTGKVRVARARTKPVKVTTTRPKVKVVVRLAASLAVGRVDVVVDAYESSPNIASAPSKIYRR